jgi:transposase
MNSLTQQILTHLIDEHESTKTRGRPNKKDTAHYLKHIFKILKSGMRWCDLDGGLYYKTYYKKFDKWVKAGIFESAHTCLMKILEASKFFNRRTQKLFIDCSMIKNVFGTDETVSFWG